MSGENHFASMGSLDHELHIEDKPSDMSYRLLLSIPLVLSSFQMKNMMNTLLLMMMIPPITGSLLE